MQPSLFTRLAVVEAELLAVKDMLAELKVNQDELRQDRDEWRWRAERLLADLQRRAWVAVVEPGRCSARRCHSELLPAARRRAEQAVRDEREPRCVAPRSSSTSIVRARTTQAQDALVPADCRSMISVLASS